MCSDYKISKNDCVSVIQKRFNCTEIELLEFEEKSVIGEVIGIMSGHYKLKTKSRINNEIVLNNFFIKRTQARYKKQTELIKVQQSFEKEYFVYEVLKCLYEEKEGYVCDYLPRCYLTVKDHLFVFEDVTDEGYIANESNFIDLNHLKVGLDALAKFHAGSIIYEHRQSAKTGRKYKIIDDFPEYFQDSLYRPNENFLGNQFFKTCVDAVLALIDIVPYFQTNKKIIRDKFLKQVDRVYDLVKPSEKFYNVVCHGDLWNNNILFKYNENNYPVHCKILDFQYIRYTIPAHDYLYFVHTNNTFFDKKTEKMLSVHYYHCLDNYLKKHNLEINNYLTYEQFLESIDYIYPFIIIQNACFANLCILRLNEKITQNEEIYTKCCFEDRSEFLIEAYQNNEIFRYNVDQGIKFLQYL